MAVIPLSFSAGGGGGSDEVTATRAEVLSGVTAITSDSNDEPVEGTLVRRGDYTAPVSMAAGGDNIYVRIQNGAYIREGGYPEIVIPKTDFGDAVASDVVSGKTFTGADGLAVAGGMVNNGAVSQELSAGGSYTVPEGYHDGSGIVTAKSLSSQTPGDATAANILTGKKAWVAGIQLTGSMQSQAGGTYNPTTSVKTLATGGKYLSSDVKVNGFALPTASKLIKGYTYSLYGQSVAGTLTKDYDLIKGSTAFVAFTNATRLQGAYCAIPVGTIAYSSSKITLKDYKYLKFYCSNFQYINSGDYFSDGTHMNSWKVGFGANGSTFTQSKTFNAYSVCSIDVSDYEGAYYILIQPNSTKPVSNSYGIVFDCYLTMS